MSSASISIVNNDVAIAPVPPPPPHIAVLGCGPGGMFFCHAIELKRKVLQERLNGFSGGGGGDSNKTATTTNTTSTAKGPTLTPEEEADPAAALLRLPIVTVFEKSSGPGGVWRAQRTFEENTVVNTNNNTCTVKDNVKQEHVVANSNVNDFKAKTKTLPEDQEEDEEDETSHTTLISSSSSASSTSSDTSPDSSPNTTDVQDCSSSSVKVSTTVKTTNSNTVVQAAASAEMYEALWCNGPKEAIEFFDYTYRDHYGMDTKLPSYLSRTEMLNVMMKRVTRNNPHFFDAVKFNTSVEKVTYDDELKKFSVVTKYVGSMEEADTNKITRYEHVFDKFIWAAGTYSRPRIPKQLSAVFQPFAACGGRVIHSSNASRLQTDAGKDKHVLLIGGSYSAEDLCLMAIKLGAKHVTIACRSCDADVAVLWQSEWPGNKVTILKGQIPVRVSDVSTTTDSSSSIKCTVEFVEYKPDEDNEEESESESEDEEDEKKDEEEKEQQDIATVLTNVDTVIFCTGYESNWDMMDPSVYNIENEDEFERFDTNAERLQLPAGWTMPHNVMTDELKRHGIGDDDEHGNVTPTKDIAPGYYAFPYSYNEVVSIHNHNLFYFNGGDYDAPLIALDAQAFVMLAIITGAHVMPDSALEMKRINHEEALYEMTLPAVRFQMDKNYSRAIRQLPNYPWPKHWIECVKDLTQWQLCRLGQLMRIGRYPIQIVKNGGTLHDGTMVLAEKGQALLNMDYNCRKYDTKASDNNTFRDIEEEHCRHLASIHTGAVPVPFGKLWMDIDDLEHAPNTV